MLRFCRDCKYSSDAHYSGISETLYCMKKEIIERSSNVLSSRYDKFVTCNEARDDVICGTLGKLWEQK